MQGPLSAPTRASKKQQTRDRILANAIALFREKGIRRTRLSEVASTSEISAATLFNYFPTKGRLAEAWVRGEVETLLSSAIEESVGRDRSLRSAIRFACRECAAASAGEPALRLEAWQEAGRAAGNPLAHDARLVEGLRLEQKREHVRADLSASDLSETLMDAIEGGLIAGLRSLCGSLDSSTVLDSSHADLFRAIRSRVDLVLDGFRKRNERVAAPGRPPPPPPLATAP
jgi:AcrR family transcriptional regulator